MRSNKLVSFALILPISGVIAWDFTYEARTVSYIKAEEYTSSSTPTATSTSNSLTSSSSTTPLTSASSEAPQFSGYFNSTSTSDTLSLTSTSGSSSSSSGSSSSSSSSSTGTSTTSTSTSTALSSFASLILSAHNSYRALHGSPALTWSTELADFAQTYIDDGNQDACTGTLIHSATYYGEATGYGENLAVGYSYTGAVDAWYSEEANYDYDNPGSSANGAIGHFTQVVWNTTTELGCAYRYCSPTWSNYIVCEYYPPGNVIGQYGSHVPPLL